MKTKVQNALGMLKELKGVKCKGTVVYSRGEQVGQYSLGYVRILNFIPREEQKTVKGFVLKFLIMVKYM